MQWMCQLFVKTGTPPDEELMVLLRGGGSSFVSGGGWINTPELWASSGLDSGYSLSTVVDKWQQTGMNI